MISMFKSTLAVRALTYGYANARAKSMRTLLLTKRDFDTMLDANSADEILSILEKSAYREELVEAGLKFSGANLIEIALGKNFSKVLQKIVKIAPPDAKLLINTIAEKWDVHNLKTILLAKALGKKGDEIAPFLVFAGSLMKSTYEKLLAATSVEKVAEIMETHPQGTIIEKHLKDFKEKTELMPMLLGLDKWYYSQLPKTVPTGYKDERIILGLLKSEIDYRNISNILRAKREGFDAKTIKQFVIEGGGLYSSELNNLIKAKTKEEEIASVQRLYDLRVPLEKFKKDSSLIHFEVALEHGIVQKAVQTLRRSILSVGALVGYLYLKEAEISNIRKIIRAKDYRLQKSAIDEMIIPTW